MGGHGALVCALKNPGAYRSVSAFAPICNPVNCAWGVKAFSGYLGESKDEWQHWDATCLVQKYNGPPLDIFIDQVISYIIHSLEQSVLYNSNGIILLIYSCYEATRTD